MTQPSLTRLLQLASPALPVGAYTYSQGLEWATETGSVRDEATTEDWLGNLLDTSVRRYEAPMLARLIDAWRQADHARVMALNDDYLASRETAELRAETIQMGYSLVRLLRELEEFSATELAPLAALSPAAFPAAWSFAAVAWEIPTPHAVTAAIWAWLENQVMAAVKLVPLGQTAGQRLLLRLGKRIATIAQASIELPDAQLSNFAPGYAIASSRHERQYSRLFRS